MIERLQRACEEANRTQTEADEVGFAVKAKDSQPAPGSQAKARVNSRRASDHAYALHEEILLEQPETERDVVIVLAHLLQQMDLITVDYCTRQSLLARRAVQALLNWHLEHAGPQNLSGWAAEAILDTQALFATRPPEPSPVSKAMFKR